MSIDHVQFRLLSEQDVLKLSVVPILYQNPFVHFKIKENGLHDLRMGATTQFDPCQTCHESIETCNGHFGHITFAYPIYHALCFKTLAKSLNCICFNCFRLIIDIDQSSTLSKELKTKTRSNRQMRKDQFDELTSTGTLDFLHILSKHKTRCEQCDFPRHQIEPRKTKLDLNIVWKPPNKTNKKRLNPTPLSSSSLFLNPMDRKYAEQLSIHFDAGLILFCLRQLPKQTCEWILGSLDPTCFLLMNLLVPPSITRPYVSQGKSMGMNELTEKLYYVVGANVTLQSRSHPVWIQFTQKVLHAQFDCTHVPPEWVFFEIWCEEEQKAGNVFLTPSFIQTCIELGADRNEWARLTRTECLKQFVLFWIHIRSELVTAKWLEHYELLKYYGSVFLDNSLRMYKPEKKTIKLNAFSKGILQRLKGKFGRFRWNLQGKRVDHCARSVVVPEAFLDIDELGVPIFIAKQLTLSETVQSYNRSKLQDLVRRGTGKWPGANYVVKQEMGDNKMTLDLEMLSQAERDTIAKELQHGDEVLRHLQDGDICLFNRQPSLHRSSIMGHRVRVFPHLKGIALNECVTHPYNADFDGDEMNLHVPQSIESRAEVKELIMVDKQWANHQNLGLTFGMKQNPLLALYQLSSLDVWLKRDEMMQYTMVLGNVFSLPEPALSCPVPLWSGRQLIVMAFPEGFEYHRNDVLIRDGEMTGNGLLDKKHLGAGQGQVFHVLLHQFGSDILKQVFSNLHRLGSEWFLHNGFSVGLSDCFNMSTTTVQKRHQMFQLVESTLQQNDSQNERIAVSEVKTNHFLNTLLNFTHPSIGPENRLLKMVASGSKGNPTNLTQIMCMLGQQNIDGKRLQKPLYPLLKSERTPKQSGLIKRSYIEGLDTIEFFTHCAAGRKGLVDTAVNTAGTGYAQRKLIKILESVHVSSDGFIRTTDQQIVNVCYGTCNLDVSFLLPYKLQNPPTASSDLDHLNLLFEQQTFLGQNRQHSLSKHVHVSKLLPPSTIIQIPFNIEHVWKQFMQNFPVDPNPQEMNLPLWDRRYNVLKLLLFDWFQQTNDDGLPLHPYREDFVDYLKQLYETKFVPPGEAVGGLASESIGEPATQMTLNTFHYTGIHQQNVTNGIPRLRELLSVSKQKKGSKPKGIKTPMIFGYLLDDIHQNEHTTSRLESFCNTIVQRCVYFFFSNVRLENQSILIAFDHERLVKYQLSPFVIAQLIRTHLKTMDIKIYKRIIDLQTSLSFQIHPTDRIMIQITCHPFIPETVQQILSAMRSEWTVMGVPGVESAHIYQIANDHLISIAGTNDMNLRDIWSVYPIDYRRTFSNKITEIETVLGIDAAKYMLFKEMKSAFSLEGSVVHDTHLRLVVDVMTCTGRLLPTDRHGLDQFAPNNILTRASFEKNMDILRQAAISNDQQQLTSISESIMVGSDLLLGTGVSKVVSTNEEKNESAKEEVNRVFVSTSDWNDFSNFAFGSSQHQHSDSWNNYMTLMEHIETWCIQTITQHIRRLPTTSTTNVEPTAYSKSRKYDLVQMHVHYRPSSPILLPVDSPSSSMDNGGNDGKDESVESNNVDNDPNRSSSLPPPPLTVESISDLMKSLQETTPSNALGLMQQLVSKSLIFAFEEASTS